MKKYCLLFISFILNSAIMFAQNDITFTTQAPMTAVKGVQFKVIYLLEGKGESAVSGTKIDVPETIKGFDVLFGPGISSSTSVSVFNNKTTIKSSTGYVYTLMPTEEGNFIIPAAKIQVSGRTFVSKPKNIRVLPPDKGSQPQPQQGQSQPQDQPQATSSNSIGRIDPKDVFVRAVFSKTKLAEQEAVTVTFRFYTVLDVRQVGKIEFPEFEGFLTEDFELNAQRQFVYERFEGRNYKVIDVKKSLLFPQHSGKITIPPGTLEFIFYIKSGEQMDTFLGPQDLRAEVRKVLNTNPITVDVSALPEGKPLNFSGGVGSFTFNSAISTQKVTANSPMKLTFNINGTGNLKLIRNPQVEFPKEFESYDPKIDNNYRVTDGGQMGSKMIEYMFIPRNAGTYTIPPVEFSYFDINTRTYKNYKSPEYKIEVDPDPDAGKRKSATNYMNDDDSDDLKDIRYLKTDNLAFKNSSDFTINSVGYAFWYVIPILIFFILYVLNRQRIKANADVIGSKTRKANKVAIKRLKLANKYLSAHNKDGFYEEILRAVWGYLSDKLSISVADLNRENVESELNRFGADELLVKQFISVLDTAEFARYAPAESGKAMDKLYAESADAIGKMENVVKIKR